MDRLLVSFRLLPLLCVACGGCQAPMPKWDPFAMGGPTKVAPPPTGAAQANAGPLGNPGRPGNTFPSSTAPLSSPNVTPLPDPPVGDPTLGSYTPGSNRPSRNEYAMTGLARSTPNFRPPGSDVTAVSQAGAQGGVNDQALRWRDPHEAADQPVLPTSAYGAVGSGIASGNSIVSYPRSAPGFTPWDRNQPAQLDPSLISRSAMGPPPVSSPPRIRGFTNAGVRELQIPSEVADVRGEVAAPDAWRSAR